MKPETLDALLIDCQLGELPPDVAELLDAYLQVTPVARQRADVMKRTVDTARHAVRTFPELAQSAEIRRSPNVVPMAHWLKPWASRIATVAAVGVFGAFVGYRAGLNTIPIHATRVAERSVVEAVAAPPTTPEHKDLWARYNVAFDRHRGTFTVSLQP